MSKMIQTYNKGSCIEIEADDLLQITRLAEESLKRTHGRPTLYEDSEQGLELFWNKATDFFSYINKVNGSPDLEKKLVPDVENFCCFMGFTRKTLALYRKRNSQWEMAIDLIKDALLACKKQLVMTHRLPPLIFIFDSVNNHDYRNVAEFHLATEPPQDTASPAITTAELQRLVDTTADVPQLPELPERDFSEKGKN